MIPLIMRYLLVILLLIPPFIIANEKDASECLDIKDPALRLSCYDSLFKNEPTEEPKLITPKKKREVIVTNKDKEIKKERERRFGLPKREVNKEQKIEIRDKIAKVTQLTSLRLDVTLDNDQKWRSVEKIRQIRLKPGQEVTISEGFISGYVLKVVGKKISIRVRRIK